MTFWYLADDNGEPGCMLWFKTIDAAIDFKLKIERVYPDHDTLTPTYINDFYMRNIQDGPLILYGNGNAYIADPLRILCARELGAPYWILNPYH